VHDGASSTQMRALVYISPRCPLCDEVRAAFDQVIPLEVVDITRDTALRQRYRYAVPVVEIDGIERLRAPFTKTELEAAVAAVRGSSRRA